MTFKITIHCDDSILGGQDYIPELTVTLDEDGNVTVAATDRHQAHNGIPMDEWNGRTRVWGTTLSQGDLAVGDAEKVNSLAETLRPLLERVHAGHDVDWDGSNMRGSLDDDADDASDVIMRLVEEADWTADVEVWDATEWLGDALTQIAEDLGLTVDADAAGRAKAASALEAAAAGDGQRLHDVDEAIIALIEHLADQIADAE